MKGKFGHLLACVVVALFLAGCARQSASSDRAQPEPIAVRIATPKHVRVPAEVVVSGTVETPSAPTTVGFLVSGKVIRVGPREGDFVKAGEAQLIADNACAHLFVLGAPAPADWRAADLVEQRPVVALRGERFVGYGGNVLGDPRLALTWLANELRGLGVTLKAGEVVTTGTCHPPLPIQSGDRFEADFGIFGKVSVALI